MNRREMILRSGAVAVGLGLSAFPLGWVADAQQKRRKLLCFTKSAGFEHSVVKREGDNLSYAERILVDLGKKNGFDVTATKDGRVFTPENLAQYDAFYFYTTGDLTQTGTDGQPPMTPEGKAAFMDAVKNGKGFVGGHTATDTFHSRGGRIDPYIAMLGGEFTGHDAQQEARMIVADTRFPGLRRLGADFRLTDEWYAMSNFAQDMHVLLVQDTQGMEGRNYKRGPYPATWARQHGKGRVFHCSMGHREDVWTNPIFQAVLLGGLSWAFGNVRARVAPNLERVAPRYAEMPTG